MTQFLKKNAKLFYILFAVFSFVFIIIACLFMTNYNRIAVEYTQEFLISGKPTILTGLNTFCKKTGFDYAELYGLMFDVNANLQAANNMVLYLGVVSLIMVAVMFICANATRKKYYISNLVSGIACPSVCIIMGIVAIAFMAVCVGDINVNYDTLNWASLANSDNYNEAATMYLNNPNDTSAFYVNSTPLIIYIVIVVLFIVASGALIAYNVFRYLDTKKELNLSSVESNETLEQSSERMVEANA